MKDMVVVVRNRKSGVSQVYTNSVAPQNFYARAVQFTIRDRQFPVVNGGKEPSCSHLFARYFNGDGHRQSRI